MSNSEGTVSSPGPAARPPGRTPLAANVSAEAPAKPAFGWLSLIVALAILGAFAYFVSEMLAIAQGATELEWSRKIVIFNSVQALAFGAAGLIFGNRIERINTQEAQRSAKDATQKLIEARELAALAVQNGARLRDHIEAISARGGATEAAIPIPALQELRLEATRLFPD